MMFVDLGAQRDVMGRVSWRLVGRQETEGLGRLRQSVSTMTKGRGF